MKNDKKIIIFCLIMSCIAPLVILMYLLKSVDVFNIVALSISFCLIPISVICLVKQIRKDKISKNNKNKK